MKTKPSDQSLARLAVFVVFSMIMADSPVRGAEVRGPQSGVWTLAASPYVVTNDVVIPAGATLTIEPGVVVKFAGAYSFIVEGALRAIGRPTHRIVFTSIHDKDFFHMGSASSQAPNGDDWIGVKFTDSSNDDECVLENVIIRYCQNPIEVMQAYPKLKGIITADCNANVLMVNSRFYPIKNVVDQEFNFVRDDGLSTPAPAATAFKEPPSPQPAANLASSTPPAKNPAPQDKKDLKKLLSRQEFTFGEITEIKVITASKFAQPISLAPAIIDVITAEQIQQMGAQTLEDVVMFLTSVQTPMDRKGYTQFWVRGLGGQYNNKTLLLVNGYPLRRLWFAHHPLDEELPLDNVERIEVIRGPGSALYGANALAGVINVITKNPLDFTDAQFSISGGNKETGKTNLLFGKSSDFGSVGGSLTYFDTRGDFIDLDKYAYPNQKYDERNTINMEAMAQAGDFTLRTFYNNYKSQFRTQDFNEDLHYDKKTYGLNLEYNHAFSDQLSLASKNYYNRFPWSDRGNIYSGTINQDLDQNLNNRIEVLIDRFIDSQVLGSDLQLTWQPVAKNTMIAGLNFERENLKEFYEVARLNWYENTIIFDNPTDRDDLIDDYDEDYSFTFETYELFVDRNGDKVVDDTLYVAKPNQAGVHNEYTQRPLPIVNNNIAFYLQDTWQASKTVDVIAGFRYDYHDVYGGSFSPRSGLIVRPFKNATVKLLYNQAFRAPAYFELYLGRAEKDDNSGNPNLKPERIQAIDLELNVQLSKAASAKVGLFHQKITDFIQAVGADTIRNRGTRQSRGLEIGLNYRFSKDTYAFANASMIGVQDLDAQEFALVWTTPEKDKSKFKVKPTGKIKDIEVSNIAPVLANVGINFGQFKYANLNLMAHYEGRRNPPLDYHAGIRSRRGRDQYFLADNLGAYIVTNLTLVSKNFLAPWEFSLGVRNLFDTEYYSPGYQPGQYYDVRRNRRNILFKASYQF